jgi:hypothetical protein
MNVSYKSSSLISDRSMPNFEHGGTLFPHHHTRADFKGVLSIVVDSSIAETNATLQFNHEATATNPLCNDDILCS